MSSHEPAHDVEAVTADSIQIRRTVTLNYSAGPTIAEPFGRFGKFRFGVLESVRIVFDWSTLYGRWEPHMIQNAIVRPILKSGAEGIARRIVKYGTPTAAEGELQAIIAALVAEHTPTETPNIEPTS